MAGKRDFFGLDREEAVHKQKMRLIAAVAAVAVIAVIVIIVVRVSGTSKKKAAESAPRRAYISIRKAKTGKHPLSGSLKPCGPYASSLSLVAIADFLCAALFLCSRPLAAARSTVLTATL